MTAVEDDFTGYVGARWPALVRTLVLLGCPIEVAPDVVAVGLSRCRAGWRETAEHDDLEVVVHRAVLQAWEERKHEPWWADLRPRTEDDWPLPDLSVLDRLTPEVRTGLVLRRFSALDAAQAVAIAGREAGGALPVAPDGPTLLAAADAVVVYAPPPDTGVGDPRPGRRRRRLLVLVGGLAAVLVLGGGTWWANRDRGETDGSLAAVEPQRVRNAAAVPWFAEGVLHLAEASYAIPGLREFAALGAGAVYSDADGEVVLLSDSGTRTRLGRKDPDAPLVASDARGQVAWVTGGSAQQLLVYDLAQGEIVGELDLPPSATGPDEVTDTRPVAFDGDRLYYATANGWGAWVPGERDPVDTGREDLYDVASGNRMFQYDDRHLKLTQPVVVDFPFVVLGRGGQLSDDGGYVVTRSPDDGSVLVYDTRTGLRVDVAPPPGLDVVAATPSPALSVTYLAVDTDAFAQPAGSDSVPNEGQVITCRLDTPDLGECTDPVAFVTRSGDLLLGR